MAIRTATDENSCPKGPPHKMKTLRIAVWCGLWLMLFALQAGSTSPPHQHAEPSVKAQALESSSSIFAARLSMAPPGTPATSRASQLTPHGYVEQEFFLEGKAQHYQPEPGWGKDGHWRVKPHGDAPPYLTRLLVRRPADASRFNGVIVVEWLNTTPGFDLDGGWILTRQEIMDQGHVWVGVSTQTEGVSALRRHSPRYEALRLASNEGVHAVFGQTGHVIRAHWPTLLGLPTQAQAPEPRQPLQVLAMGYSQSALYLYTYINTFAPQDRVFDGFYLRGPAPLAPSVETDGDDIWAPTFRTDLDAKIMQVQTEAEAMVSWPLSKTADTDKVRYWEISGAAHLDAHLQSEMAVITPPHAAAKPHTCWRPLNDLPAYMVDHAALHALSRWVRDDVAPPIAPRMRRNTLGFVKTDETGHAMEGLRLPDIDAPVARYGHYSNLSTSSMSIQAQYACIAGGSKVKISRSELEKRHATPSQYLEAYRASADHLLNRGFLLPRDHKELLRRAQHAPRIQWSKLDEMAPKWADLH